MRRYLVSDSEIFRAARLLIDQHGEEASLRAAVRADDLLEGSDVIGSTAWHRFLGAVEELSGQARGRGGELRNQSHRSSAAVAPIFLAETMEKPKWTM
jgi:hypothetical protein